MECSLEHRQIGSRCTLPLAGLALLGSGGLPGAQDRPMNPVELLSVETVGVPAFGPRGERMLFARSQADWECDRSRTHIWLVDTGGGPPRQMTNGPTSETEPVWAPDGNQFAFLSDRSEEGGRTDQEDARTQIYRMRVDGGEATQLTQHPTPVRQLAWSPAGDRIFFVAEDDKSKEQREREHASGDSVVYPRNWMHDHLWSVNVESGKEQRLTRGDWSVLEFSVTRDGRQIAFGRSPTPLYDDVDQVELYTVDLVMGTIRRLTDNDGIPERRPLISPDGRWVAFTADAAPVGSGGELDFYYETNLFLMPLTGGPAQLLLAEMPGEIGRIAWNGDGTALYALVNLGVHSEVFRVDLEEFPGGEVGGSATQLTAAGEPPSSTITGFDFVPDHGFALLRKLPHNQGELRYASSDPFIERQVTDLHVGLQREFSLPRAEVVTWTGADGVAVEGVLWSSKNATAGERSPLIVQIHGGPVASVQLELRPSWGTYVPVLTGMGYRVLQPNYRGGSGYGDDFQRDMVGAYFNQADDDVYRGVDALIERRLVDPERTAIMGWSAGGHMTNWVVTQTERFAAASSGAGAANWISMYAQSDVRIYRTPWFGGTPWQPRAPLQAYLDHSPALYAHQATTPTLILVGEDDRRVPMPQSVEMYRALDHSGVASKLVIFPGEPHGLLQLKHRLHKINLELEWFERHLHGRDFTYAVAPMSEDRE